MGVASLVLGIIGMVLSLAFFWLAGFVIGVPLTLVGLVLGIVGRKSAVANNQPPGLATAGLVVSVIGLVFGVVLWGLCGLACHSAQRSWDKAINDPAFLQKLNDTKLNKDFDDTFNQAIKDAAKQPPSHVVTGKAATPPAAAPGK
ncbi:MAG: DUF4190 domain-containing protein [Polyangia bacterium]